MKTISILIHYISAFLLCLISMPAEAKSLNQILAAENYNGDTKLSEILHNELGSMET